MGGRDGRRVLAGAPAVPTRLCPCGRGHYSCAVASYQPRRRRSSCGDDTCTPATSSPPCTTSMGANSAAAGGRSHGWRAAVAGLPPALRERLNLPVACRADGRSCKKALSRAVPVVRTPTTHEHLSGCTRNDAVAWTTCASANCAQRAGVLHLPGLGRQFVSLHCVTVTPPSSWGHVACGWLKRTVGASLLRNCAAPQRHTATEFIWHRLHGYSARWRCAA
jgi:hypothetical protein